MELASPDRSFNPEAASCKGGCGFFGNPALGGYCSLCDKENGGTGVAQGGGGGSEEFKTTNPTTNATPETKGLAEFEPTNPTITLTETQGAEESKTTKSTANLTPETHELEASTRKATTSVTETQGLRITKVYCFEAQQHVFAVKFSPDGKFFACTYGNGACRVFDSETFVTMHRMRCLTEHYGNPSTSVKWANVKQEGVYNLATCSSKGAIHLWRWDLNDDRGMERVWHALEEGNETVCIDYSPDGKKLVSVGSDRKVRVYDTVHHKLVDILEKGYDDEHRSLDAHTSRIFCAHFASDDTLLTAGWATAVQLWNMQTKRAELQLRGPNVGSDAIEDIHGNNRVVIASNRSKNQLQVFNSLSGVHEEEHSEKLSQNIPGVAVMGVRYVRDTNSLLCFGHEPNALVHLDAESGEVRGIIDDLGVPLYAGDAVEALPRRAIFVGANERIFIVDVLSSRSQRENPHKARLVRMLTKYAPDKLDQADAMLAKYPGKEEKIFASLVKRMGPEPPNPGAASPNPSVPTKRKV